MLLVNIGGSRIRIARRSISTGLLEVVVDERASDRLADLLALVGGVVHSGGDVDLVAVACPGLVSSDGTVAAALHSAVAHTDLKAEIEAVCDAEAFVANDASVQAAGLAAGRSDALFVALGTSVGGAVLRCGTVLDGGLGHSGEIGHLGSVYAEGRCRCGLERCLDLVASGWSIEDDLGSDWWRSAESTWRARIELAGLAVGAVGADLQPLLSNEILIVGGHLASLEVFRQSVQSSFSVPATWGEPKVEFVSDLDQLTWKGLIAVTGRKN